MPDVLKLDKGIRNSNKHISYGTYIFYVSFVDWVRHFIALKNTRPCNIENAHVKRARYHKKVNGSLRLKKKWSLTSSERLSLRSLNTKAAWILVGMIEKILESKYLGSQTHQPHEDFKLPDSNFSVISYIISLFSQLGEKLMSGHYFLQYYHQSKTPKET